MEQKTGSIGHNLINNNIGGVSANWNNQQQMYHHPAHYNLQNMQQQQQQQQSPHQLSHNA